jgi:hypothetical protein
MINIVFIMLKEILLSMVAKVAFKAVAERFATRLVVYGLEKLEGYSTNEVTSGLVKDILASLEGKGLKAL